MIAASACALSLAVASAGAASVATLRGCDAPGPARYDRVRVLKQGPARAKHVLVLEPGTSAGAAYFRPLASQIVQPPSWLAGVVGGASREPARGPLGPQPRPGREGDDPRALRLLPGLALRPLDHDHIHPVGADGGFVAQLGDERRGLRPAPGDRRGPPGGEGSSSAATRWAARSPRRTRAGTSAGRPGPGPRRPRLHRRPHDRRAAEQVRGGAAARRSSDLLAVPRPARRRGCPGRRAPSTPSARPRPCGPRRRRRSSRPGRSSGQT